MRTYTVVEIVPGPFGITPPRDKFRGECNGEPTGPWRRTYALAKSDNDSHRAEAPAPRLRPRARRA